ncbi:MAG: hypothetical protein M3N13_00225 [Candidatus Eremiobacteraeota bacterium]|nr:hypothetical protein [Candidatus Eremiobacteraeota bacterium]
MILLKKDLFNERHDEDYARRLDMPVSGFPDVNVVFASYRNFNEVDFQNVIFLVVTFS